MNRTKFAGPYTVNLDGNKNDFNGMGPDIIPAVLFSAGSLQQGLHTINITNTNTNDRDYLDIDFVRLSIHLSIYVSCLPLDHIYCACRS